MKNEQKYKWRRWYDINVFEHISEALWHSIASVLNDHREIIKYMHLSFRFDAEGNAFHLKHFFFSVLFCICFVSNFICWVIFFHFIDDDEMSTSTIQLIFISLFFSFVHLMNSLFFSAILRNDEEHLKAKLFIVDLIINVWQMKNATSTSVRADWNMKRSDKRRVGMLKIKFTTLSFNLIASTRHWKLHTEGSKLHKTQKYIITKKQKQSELALRSFLYAAIFLLFSLFHLMRFSLHFTQCTHNAQRNAIHLMINADCINKFLYHLRHIANDNSSLFLQNSFMFAI